MIENVTVEMIEAGQAIAEDLIVASVSKQMRGLGGSLTWDEWCDQHKDTPNLDLIKAFADGEIASVTAIYLAMKRVEKSA